MSSLHVYHHDGNNYTPHAPIGDTIDAIRNGIKKIQKRRKFNRDVKEFERWLAEPPVRKNKKKK